MAKDPEYILGTNDSELARLEFQHSVWRDLAEGLLDRAGVLPGMTVLDLGCGPGFVTEELARRVGTTGQVVALDESPRWHGVLRDKSFDAPLEAIEARIEDADLGEARFDVVFSRWVFSFLPDLAGVCSKIHRALKPGGKLLVQDYQHNGVSVFPPSAGFDAVVRATRAYYTAAGGDPWVMGTLGGVARGAGFEILDQRPHVKSGGPESGVFRWVDLFFPKFSSVYVEKGLMTPEEQELYLTDWESMKHLPDSLFFSPMIVDLVAQRP